jgi:thioredoxin 2
MTAKTTPARPVTVRCTFCATRNRIDLARLVDGPRCGSCKRPILLDRPIPVTEADFDETLRSAAVPVVVDFYADWCGPCRAMAPALDELAGRHAGHLLVTKLDADRFPALAQRFGIRGIPTLIAFDGGRELRRHVGMADLAALEALAGVR